MPAPADTTLRSLIKVNVNTQYRRTDLPLSLQDTVDNVSYPDISHTFTDGKGDNKNDLQYHARRRLINASEGLDLDGVLKNVWGHTLNYDAVKILVIRNRESPGGMAGDAYLMVTFKDEKYYIGPGGSRVIVEPIGRGIHAVTSSSSAEEGQILVTAFGDVTYDIIILGASGEAASGA